MQLILQGVMSYGIIEDITLKAVMTCDSDNTYFICIFTPFTLFKIQILTLTLRIRF